MSPSEKEQHAIRRSTRLPLEVPVLVIGLDPARPFSEQCNTTLVNAHGCGLIAPCQFEHGIQVRLQIVSARRHTTARVAEVVPLGGDPETWLVGLELEVPGNFWGIEYAPADWKIEETMASAVPPRPDPEAAAAPAKPGRPPRWRLTDISAGACYLESPEPFPADTPVILSIRALNTECLLEGVVRGSHARTGMGVEFAGALQDQQTKVGELITRLMSNREVPKIFVGRKERHDERRKENEPAAPTTAARVESDTDAADPLLELVCSGASLTAEQFLSDLR